MYVSLTCALLLVALAAEGQDPSGVVLKTRTTTVTSVQGATHAGRSHSKSIYIQGSRVRTDDNWDAFQIATSSASSWIEQCDLKRIVFLEHGPRVYEIRPFPDEAAQREWEQKREKAIADYKAGTLKITPASPDAPVISFETVDTGERKNVSGFMLRHIHQTETMPAKLNGQMGDRIDTRDGWYLDLPSPDACADSRMPKGGKGFTFAYLSAGLDVRPRFMTKGNTSPRLPEVVEETYTSKYGSGMTVVEKTELVELSKGSLDPKLFELTEGYRPALHTPNGGRDLMRPDTITNRTRAWWEYYSRRWQIR